MIIGPLTRKAALTLKSGDKLTARIQFMQALESGESPGEIWYWLAVCADIIDEKRTYLVKSLEANPTNEDARNLLSQITNTDIPTQSTKTTQYEYLVIPFQGQLREGGQVAEVSNQLQKVINKYSSEGWNFVAVNNINIQITPGCLSILSGARQSYVTYDQIIFRRDKIT